MDREPEAEGEGVIIDVRVVVTTCSDELKGVAEGWSENRDVESLLLPLDD